MSSAPPTLSCGALLTLCLPYMGTSHKTVTDEKCTLCLRPAFCKQRPGLPYLTLRGWHVTA